MSAWIVSKAHIDVLVQELAVRGIIPWAETTAVGQMLWQENHNSINARYREDTNAPEYTFEGVEAPLDPAKIVMLVHCFDYQSCEHDEWLTSRAYDLVERLKAVLLAELGLTDDTWWEYRNVHDLPWGINDIHEVIKKPDTILDVVDHYRRGSAQLRDERETP